VRYSARARRKALMRSVGERMRTAFLIERVCNQRSQLKDFLRRYGRISTSYLNYYWRWYQRLALENALPRTCLATVIGT